MEIMNTLLFKIYCTNYINTHYSCLIMQTKIIFLILLLTVLSACSAETQPQIKENKGVSAGGENAYVRINNFKFVPKELHVKTGTTVTWKNDDSAPHNVVSSDGTLQSPNLQKGDSWSHTFNEKGEFNYICSIHPVMQGKVIVN